MTKSCWQVSNSGPLSKMEIWMYGRTDDGMKSFYLSLKWKYQCKMSVCTNVTDGQTSFSYFSLVSVQSHTVKFNCPYGGPDKKKLTDKHKHRQKVIQQTAIRSIDWCNTFNGKKICFDIHLKQLKLQSDLQSNRRNAMIRLQCYNTMQVAGRSARAEERGLVVWRLPQSLHWIRAEAALKALLDSDLKNSTHHARLATVDAWMMLMLAGSWCDITLPSPLCDPDLKRHDALHTKNKDMRQSRYKLSQQGSSHRDKAWTAAKNTASLVMRTLL
jgi:hypothetical protein